MARKLVLLGAMALFALPALAAAASAPRVWLEDAAPAVVRGAGFHPREVVVVTVSAGTSHLRGHATSTANGAFVVRFRSSVDTGCRSTFVTAVDASGRRAVLKIVPSGCGTQQGP